MNLARALWLRVETLHAVTYFGEETAAAAGQLGLGGFWAGYFALRSAPLGPAPAGVVQASFFNFAPGFVGRWVPAVWEDVLPRECISGRAAAAAVTLQRLVPDVGLVAELVNPVLQGVVQQCKMAGRVLGAANRDLVLPADPVAAMWQLCTTLREHRGDGHVAALTAAGLDGLEAHILFAAEHGSDPGDLQRTRGWTADNWKTGVGRCVERGWLDPDQALTAKGFELRSEIESITDRLAIDPWDDDSAQAALNLLTSAAQSVARSGLIRYPNPMGLPQI